jgi:hypothetical protein
MSRLFLVSAVSALTLAVSVVAFATDVSGPITGTWTQDKSPYYVAGNASVPSGGILTIEERVDVIFSDYFTFGVGPGATLKVQGTEAERVRFTAALPESGWGRLTLFRASPACAPSHAVIEYAKDGGVMVQSSSLAIAHSRIQKMSGGAALSPADGASGFLSDSSIADNDDCGVSCAGSLLNLQGTMLARNAKSGVFIAGSSAKATIRNCMILGHRSYDSGLHVDAADRVIVADMEFLDSGGRGVDCEDVGRLVLERCLVTGSAGSGVNLVRLDALIRDCTLSGNNGVGLGADATSLRMEGTLCYGNGGRGANIAYSCSGTIDGCTFARNLSGGLRVATGAMQASNSAFLDNTLSDQTNNDGGGLYLFGAAEVMDCLTAGNRAPDWGLDAGIYVYHAHPTLCHLTSSDNEAKSGGGAIYLENSSSVELRNSI